MTNKLHHYAVRTGRALATPVVQRMCTGVVLEYFSGTQSYRVRTGTGELSEIPRITHDPGDNTILPVDTVVVLHNELGFWVIDGVLKQTPVFPTEFNRARVTEFSAVGGDDPLNEQSNNAASYRGAGDPRDLLPSDWVRHSGDGNFIGALAGGMNVLHSAPFAQVRTHAVTNSVEVLAHEYRHLSAMGTLEILSDGGKTSLHWRAGADQGTENGAGAGNWTLRFDAGAGGDLLRLRVTTPQGQTLSELHLDPEGRMALTGVGGVDITSGATLRQDVLEDARTVIGGSCFETVSFDAISSVGGSCQASVGGNSLVTIGGGASANVTGDQLFTVGGHVTGVVGKSSRVDVNEGYLDVVLGDPLKGKGGGAFSVVNYGGDILLQPSSTAGKLVAFGSMPGSVMLGADAIPKPRDDGSLTSESMAPYSAMLFEHFNSMMSTLLNLLDTHVHPSAVGPTGPPLIPSSPAVTPLLTPIQSLRVKLGG